MINCPPLSLYATLDAALASDYVVLLLSSTYEVTEQGERILRCLQSVIGGGGGQAEVVACVQSPRSQPMTPQTRPGVLKSLLSFTTYFFPSVNKVHVIPTDPDATSSDANNLARAFLEGVPAGASSINLERGGAGIKGRGRDGRGWLVGEVNDTRWKNATTTEQPPLGYQLDSPEAETGTLSVTGTIRGATLSADRLVHIPGWGDFQVDSITSAPLPKPARAVTNSSQTAAMSLDDDQVLSAPGQDADDLIALNDVDTLNNEQTWPTEEEMAHGEAMMRDYDASTSASAAAAAANKKRVKRVPKGTSAYQAAWILDDEDDNDAVVTDEEEDGMMQDGDDLDEDGMAGGAELGFGKSVDAQVDDDDDDQEETEEVELDERRVEEEELDDAEEERQ